MHPLSGRGRGGAVREPRHVWVLTQSVSGISRVVSDIKRAESFYRSVLRFGGVSQGPADPQVLRALGAEGDAVERRLRLGEEDVVLVQFESAGRNHPADCRSDDLCFQHLAIVVSDMDAAYSRLRSSTGWRPISTEGPETLPASSGGVRAFKFRDPDGHPLELLYFPPRHADPKWRERARSSASDQLFLGIDHTALSVSSSRRSLAFYRSLGLCITQQTLNSGPAQSRLDGLAAAHVRVTGLHPSSGAGPGLELLAYRPPGRSSAQPGATDVSMQWTTLGAIAPDPAAGNDHASALAPLKKISAVSDPDGHRFVLVSQGASRGQPA